VRTHLAHARKVAGPPELVPNTRLALPGPVRAPTIWRRLRPRPYHRCRGCDRLDTV